MIEFYFQWKNAGIPPELRRKDNKWQILLFFPPRMSINDWFFVMSHRADLLLLLDNDSQELATTEITLYHYVNKIHENFGTLQCRWKKTKLFRTRTEYNPPIKSWKEHARKMHVMQYRHIDSRESHYYPILLRQI